MAQNFLKKQNMLKKYKGLEAKLEGVKIQIANIQTTDTLVSTMKNMAGMLNQSANSIDINNIQHVITDFNMQMEKNAVMGELLEDAVDMGDEDIDDDDADALIDQVAGGGEGGQKLQQNDQQDQFANDLAALKK